MSGTSRRPLAPFHLLRAPVLILPAVALALVACGSGGSEGRVLVIGLDGMDPRVIDLLMSEGKMPAFAKMRQEGAFGILHSMRPLLSPVVWTTIATGKTPDQHRIGHFTAVNQVSGEKLPVTSQMRKTQAVWNMASEHDRTVSVIGWWATWPAEKVNGTIVSDHLCYHFLFEDGFQEHTDAGAKTWPPDLVDRVGSMVKRPGALTQAEAAPFVNVSAEEWARPFDFQDDLGHFKWALSTAKSYRAIGLDLWKKDSPDLEMVYIEGTDSSSHLFGHLFRAEGLAGELAGQQARYGHTVEQMYIEADRIVGDFIDAMDERTTLMVMSDHGFQLGQLQDDPSRTRDMRRVSEKFHTPEGILYMYGNKVKSYSRLEGASILDITPTILALLGLPPASDMPGRVLTDGLDLEAPMRVDTYETGGHAGGEIAQDSEVDSEILEKLKSLGYIDAESPTGERNIAAVLFEEGRYEEAAEAYRKMVEGNPGDGSLRTSLAGALGALGRYDEALEQLEAAIAAQPLNPEAYHNRAVIRERKGETDLAVQDYQTALRYNPQYEPSQVALRRLGGSVRAGAPLTDAEKQAYRLAEEAAATARRGDYATAMARLDEAQRIAPAYSLVYQYRSNVAYLMGDRKAAIAALEKGLALEPGNALFQENLRRLKEQDQAGGR
jgi:predicted AlkP superfamily phosphohydrolase/phosphomutase/Tfp pilus assembly protein PilF